MYFKPTKRSKIRKITKIALISCAAVITVFAVLILFDVIPLFNSMKTNLRKVDYAIPDTAIANTNGILFLDNKTLYLKNLYGDGVWDLPLTEESANLTASDSIIATYNENSVLALDFNKTQLFTTKIDTPILNLKCGKKSIALHTSVKNESGVVSNFIYLYDEKGQQASRQEFFTREVLDFGFYGDVDMFWVLTLDTSAVVPTSYISTYKTDGTATGSIVINSQLIERIYVNDAGIFASGMNNFTKYTYFGEEIADDVVFGLKPYTSSLTPASLKVAYIPRVNAVRIDNVRVFADDLSGITILLPPNIISVALTQNKLYAISGSELFTYNIKGDLEKSAKIGQDFTGARQLSNDVAVVWDKKSSYILRLT